MKNLYLSLIFVTSFLGNLLANPEVDTIYSKANVLYQEAKFEEALSLYKKVDSLGFESPEIYYNMANAYYRSHNPGYARLYYERAKLLDPGDIDINTNLEFVSSMLTDRFDEVPEFFLKTWLRKAVLGLHPDRWLQLSLILFSIFILGGIFYIFLKSLKIRKTGFYLAIFSFSFSILTFAFSFLSYQKVSDPSAAIIMEGSQTVKSAPRQSGKDLFILHEGTKVALENSINKWAEIRISDGRKGWVPVESFVEI